jgi:hypothetical protein
MFWTIDYDDFEGKFCNQGRYPLLTAVKDQLYSSLEEMEAIKRQEIKTADFNPYLSIQPSILSNSHMTFQNQIVQEKIGAPFDSLVTISPNSPLMNHSPTLANYVVSANLNQDGSVKKHGTGKITNEKNSYEISRIYEKLISLETTTTTTTPLIDLLGLDDDSHFTCEADGLFVDSKTDCRAFYTCLWTKTRNAKKIRFVCPEKTKFDQLNKVCDWEWKVDCISV